MQKNDSMKKIVDLCKKRGFVYPGSDIYGGLSSSWDFGPIGVELKSNIKAIWWKKFVRQNEYNVGIDSAVLMNPMVWSASGHVSGFSDPLTDCRICKARYRVDNLIKEDISFLKSCEEMSHYLQKNKIKCPKCSSSDFTPVRNFNLMFKTYQGVVEDKLSELYLRPETAQGIFVNFLNVQKSSRKKLPFGIAQIGKSFRNEITPGNFIFRTREFEQMELEFFCKPGEDDGWFDYWQQFCMDFLCDIGVDKDSVRFKKHKKEELSHYSKATTDIEFLFPFGWGELWGIANRGDFDLKQHESFSRRSLKYFDPIMNENYIPYCIEPSVGVDRLFLALVTNAYREELLGEDVRVVMGFSPEIAPVKACVLPLLKKFCSEAKGIYSDLSKHFVVEYDENGSIGKRYRRQDEIGTLFCITYDFDSKEDGTVTIRDRDTMIQKRVSISCLKDYIEDEIKTKKV